MAIYLYQAKDSTGKNIRGQIQADNEKQARQSLKKQALLIVNIREKSAEKFWQKELSFSRKIAVEDIALFTRQLATLLSAGLPIVDALTSIIEQTEKTKIKQIIEQVKQSVMEGFSLSDAMAKFPKIFSDVYRATIQAGEQSGYLSVILLSLADHLEQQQKNKQKIQNALIYPVMMIFVSISIVAFLLSYVVPKIIGVFAQSNQALPIATQILLGISHFLTNYGLYLLIILVILFFIGLHLLKTPSKRSKFHRLLLKLPFAGKTWLQINTARFAKTVGILFSANVPILQALSVSNRLITILPVYQSLNDAAMQVREGVALNKALRATGYFSPMLIHLIANGEITGLLDKMLIKAAEMQELAVENTLETSLKLLEPLIILVMGGIVLFIVLAILLPIFSLDQMTG